VLTSIFDRFILPILAEYSDAGYREPRDRILYALRENAKYYAMVFGAGILGLIYVFIVYGVSLTSLKAPVMALAYCWGLVLAIYLMGHGLVAIPRRLIRDASISGRLRRIQSYAPKLYDKMEDAETKLEDLEIQVSELSRRKTGSALEFRDWIDELADMTSLPESQPGRLVGSGASEARTLPTVITQKYLADLTRNLIRARHAQTRYREEWNRLLVDASETQAILNSAASKRLELGKASPHAGFWDRITLLTPYTRYLVYWHVQPYAKLFGGGVLAAASVSIIWSELVKAALPDLSIIKWSVVHHWKGDQGQVGFAGQVIGAFWILYMCAAALISITEVKVWRGRALVKRNTAHESAFWYASQVARLSVPLSYNFMTFLGDGIYRETVFYEFLGKLIVLTPLGKYFDYVFPMFVLVPVCATLFGLYGRVRRFFGFGDIVEDDDEETTDVYGTGSWREGRDLIERELNGTSIRQRRMQYGVGAAGGPDATSAAGRAAPILTVPGSRRDNNNNSSSGSTGGNASTPPFATSTSNGMYAATAGSSSSRAARTLGRSGDGPLPEEADDENFFQALGHRIKNTVDTIDTPKWWQEIGQGIKKPKWMGGDDDGDDVRNLFPRTNSSSSSSDGVRRWFGGGGGGGGSGQGRIRL